MGQMIWLRKKIMCLRYYNWQKTVFSEFFQALPNNLYIILIDIFDIYKNIYMTYNNENIKFFY